MEEKKLVQAESFLIDIKEMGDDVDPHMWKFDPREITAALEKYPGVVIGEGFIFVDGSRALH